MDLFNNYDQDFRDLYESIQNRIRNLPSMQGAEKQNEIQQTYTEISEAEEVIQSMGLSARTVAGQQAILQKRVKDNEANLAKVKKDLKNVENAFNQATDRASLMAGASPMGMDTSLDQREHLVSAQTQRLNKTSATLKQTLATAQATVDIGETTLQNLAQQRNTLERMLEKLDDVNDSLSRAGRILSAMARRVVTNKIIMAIIVLVLIGAIILILYLKFAPTHSSSSSTTSTSSSSVNSVSSVSSVSSATTDGSTTSSISTTSSSTTTSA